MRGFSEQGTTTTPFDMVVLNEMSRYHLALEALRRAPRRAAGSRRALIAHCQAMLAEHHAYVARAPRGHARDPRLGVERLASFEDRLHETMRPSARLR